MAFALAGAPLVATASDYSRAECPVVGNTDSGIFHVKGCPNYMQMLEKNKTGDNRRCFANRSEASSAGFRIAKNCRKEVYLRTGD